MPTFKKFPSRLMGAASEGQIVQMLGWGYRRGQPYTFFGEHIILGGDVWLQSRLVRAFGGGDELVVHLVPLVFGGLGLWILENPSVVL